MRQRWQRRQQRLRLWQDPEQRIDSRDNGYGVAGRAGLRRGHCSGSGSGGGSAQRPQGVRGCGRRRERI
jgi:hypothetical protein